jgi:hypothetical protein
MPVAAKFRFFMIPRVKLRLPAYFYAGRIGEYPDAQIPFVLDT